MTSWADAVVDVPGQLIAGIIPIGRWLTCGDNRLVNFRSLAGMLQKDHSSQQLTRPYLPFSAKMYLGD